MPEQRKQYAIVNGARVPINVTLDFGNESKPKPQEAEAEPAPASVPTDEVTE